MSYFWSPKPFMKKDDNSLFPMDESVTVVKKGMSPMQRQRKLDGTPHTRHGASALRPEGPTLYLGEEQLSKASDGDDEKKPKYDPDEVIKAYLVHSNG